jgi:hypothetical protein
VIQKELNGVAKILLNFTHHVLNLSFLLFRLDRRHPVFLNDIVVDMLVFELETVCVGVARSAGTLRGLVGVHSA